MALRQRFRRPHGLGLLLLPEAVAYLGGGPKRSVSRRVICFGAFSEGIRTAHSTSRSGAGRPRRTYATASGESSGARLAPTRLSGILAGLVAGSVLRPRLAPRGGR